jgi:beta-galactosidase
MIPTVPGPPEGVSALGAPIPDRPTPDWPAPGWPTPGIAFGGDYNPEQRPEETRDEDVALMRDAGVTVVTVAVFAWARLRPAPGAGTTHGCTGSWTCCTATGSRSIWPPRPRPRRPGRSAPTRDPPGRHAGNPAGDRQPADLMPELAGLPYRDHPAIVMWHVSDELGNHNGSCDCDVSAAHFREWLRDKYGHVDVVNRAWRTDYWSQHYSNFPEIGTPAASTGFGNPGQLLDWRRFCSDALLEVYLAEKAVFAQDHPVDPDDDEFPGRCRSG